MFLPRLLLAFSASALLTAGSLADVVPHSYQVTGPILALTDTSITVQKGTEKWEIGRDATTKITGELKVGAKVTIEYFMSATTATVKPDAPAAKGKAK